jgi:WD40 repeat protein
VLLGSVGQGDAWFPRTVGLATVASPRADVPAARYVFALGGHLWAMGADGLPVLFRAGNTNSQTLRRFNLAPPIWSPAGDKVLTVESLSSGASAFQLVAVVIGRDGTVRRYTTPSSVGTGVSWSPDGTQIAVAALPTAASDPSVLASDLNIALVDATSGSVTRTIPGREATWTRGGIVVLTNGSVRTGDRARDDQVIEIWSGTAKKELITIAKIVADPRTQAPATTRGITQTTALLGSPDGAHASVHLNFLLASPTTSFALVRARDNTATAIVLDPVSDETWSPAGRSIGYTITLGRGTNARQRAVLRDAETGDVLADLDGRFAGWSPDGSWAYVARNDGLYARRVAGGDLVRVALYGVPVSATKP